MAEVGWSSNEREDVGDEEQCGGGTGKLARY